VVDGQTFAALLGEVRAAVDHELEQIWDEAWAEHAGQGTAVAKPLEAARALCLRGGKRLRASLVVVGHALARGRADVRSVLPVCCAVELLQSYFLIHDDWMDQDRMRRGGPAVHAALEAHFATPHLAASGAVLAGDYTLALATRVLARAQPSPGQWPALLTRFAQMQLDAVVGQKLDVLGQGENLDEVYRLKTASYTLQGPLALGMLFETPLSPWLPQLEEFAVPLGIAFQLRDDVIGAFAEPAVTGKPQGADLRAGKRTLLLETALTLASPAERQLLDRAVANPAVGAQELAAALAVLAACGARRKVEERIRALAARARAALERAHLPAFGRALLEGVLVAMIERDS
jgi:geranylgeranyl diphosphate synthase, type I